MRGNIHIKFLQRNESFRCLVSLERDNSGKLWVIKSQPKTLCDNEEYALRRMLSTAYAPRDFIRVDLEKIAIEFIENKKITSPDIFVDHIPKLLQTLEDKGLRHGDLTVKSILVRDNHPVVVDWAESRLFDDPRPDKRREGDTFWCIKSMGELALASCENETQKKKIKRKLKIYGQLYGLSI